MISAEFSKRLRGRFASLDASATAKGSHEIGHGELATALRWKAYRESHALDVAPKEFGAQGIGCFRRSPHRAQPRKARPARPRRPTEL